MVAWTVTVPVISSGYILQEHDYTTRMIYSTFWTAEGEPNFHVYIIWIRHGEELFQVVVSLIPSTVLNMDQHKDLRYAVTVLCNR